MKVGIIVVISVLGGILLLVLSICLTTFFSPIIGQILDELEEKGERVANKIHNKFHPEPQSEAIAVSLSQGLKNLNAALRKFASALGETAPSKDTCTGTCLECSRINEFEEYAELKRRKRSETQRID